MIEGYTNKTITFYIGSDYTYTREIPDVPAGQELVKLWWTVKRENDISKPDADAVMQKIITTTNQAGVGQITDTGTSGKALIRLDFTRQDTQSFEPGVSYVYDMKAQSSAGKDGVIEAGTMVAYTGATKAT